MQTFQNDNIHRPYLVHRALDVVVLEGLQAARGELQPRIADLENQLRGMRDKLVEEEQVGEPCQRGESARWI